MDEVLIGIGAIVGLGILSPWLGRRFGIPSLVLLLIAGLLAGPVFGVVDPDAIFGEALFPVVSLAVGILLFEGGLGLRLKELRGGTRTPVLRLVTIGAAITWAGATGAALLIGLPFGDAVLLGAILIVTGPTVVGPLLKAARPKDPVARVLRWEGIMIDPIGATVGVSVVAVIAEGAGTTRVPGELASTALIGAAVGLAAAALLVGSLRLFLIPDDLEPAVAVMLAVVAFVVAESIESEAGLFATTIMGVALANQPWVSPRRIQVFSETISVFVIGSLFIILASRINLDALGDYLPETLLVCLLLVVVVRPLVVLAATTRVRILSWRQRLFMMCMAPRGIVAAATAAIFTIRLEQAGTPAPAILPIVYGTIIILAVVYAFSVPAAKWLGVARPPRRGIIVFGVERWVRDLAHVLAESGVSTTLVAPGETQLDRTAHPFRVWTDLMITLPHTELLADPGMAIVAMPSREQIEIATTVVAEQLGRHDVFVLARPDDDDEEHRGIRRAFGPQVDYSDVLELVRRGAAVKVATLSAASTVTATADELPLVRITVDGGIDPYPQGRAVAGDRIVTLSLSTATSG